MKNMKIVVNENQPLDEIVMELERLGYKKMRWGGFIIDAFNDCSIRVFEDETYTDMKSKQIYDYGYEPTTLAELKEMQDAN